MILWQPVRLDVDYLIMYHQQEVANYVNKIVTNARTIPYVQSVLRVSVYRKVRVIQIAKRYRDV